MENQCREHVELHCYTKSSSDEGPTPKLVLEFAKERGMRAVGFADRDSITVYPEVQEIEICNPDIIIACSHVVFEALQDNVFKKENYERTKSIEFEDKMSGYGKCIDISSFLKREKPVYIVEYRHPSQATLQGSLRQHHENFLKIKEQLL